VIGLPQVERGFLVERFTAFLDSSAFGEDLARENQRLRSRTRRGEAPLGQQYVGTNLRHAGRLD